MGISDVSNDTLAGRPVLTAQGGGKTLGPLLNWSLSALSNGMNDLRGTDGRFLSKEGLQNGSQFLFAAMAFTIPSAMWILEALEWWTEDVRGKASPTPKLPPQAKIPFGLPMAIADPRWDWMAFVESTARVNNMFGLGQELLAYGVSDHNPYSKVREIDERVLAINVVKGVAEVVKNTGILLYHGELPSYGEVIRPFMFSAGLNGLVQHSQILTNLIPELSDLPILGDERRMSDLISMKDKLRAHSMLLGMEPRTKFGGIFLLTPQSIAIKEMEKCAYANDADGFLKAWRMAMDHSRSIDPSADVINKFKQRSLRKNLTRYTLSDTDWMVLVSSLDKESRKKVIRAETMHENYLLSIGGQPAEVKSEGTQYIEELRRLLSEQN
jgi:hypothetical protein